MAFNSSYIFRITWGAFKYSGPTPDLLNYDFCEWSPKLVYFKALQWSGVKFTASFENQHGQTLSLLTLYIGISLNADTVGQSFWLLSRLVAITFLKCIDLHYKINEIFST